MHYLPKTTYAFSIGGHLNGNVCLTVASHRGLMGQGEGDDVLNVVFSLMFYDVYMSIKIQKTF